MARQWRARNDPYPEPDNEPPQPPKRYEAIPDPYLRGEWIARPVPYRGRGIIYCFRGRGAAKRAEECADRKNQELAKK